MVTTWAACYWYLLGRGQGTVGPTTKTSVAPVPGVHRPGPAPGARLSVTGGSHWGATASALLTRARSWLKGRTPLLGLGCEVCPKAPVSRQGSQEGGGGLRAGTWSAHPA